MLYQTIYDKNVKDGIYAASTAASSPNYTLVLETSPGVSIHVALEFVNSGATSFEGADGTVNVGDKFYLIATLNPSTAGDKVFTQDFTTTANFSLLVDALKRAYNGLPDLRTPQMELGLSVDLSWRQGTIFNVDL